MWKTHHFIYQLIINLSKKYFCLFLKNIADIYLSIKMTVSLRKFNCVYMCVCVREGGESESKRKIYWDSKTTAGEILWCNG